MAEARPFGPLRVRAFLTSLFIIAVTFVLSVVATVTMPLSPHGELYLWFAQLWPKVIFAVGGIRYRRRISPQLDLSERYIYLSNHESLTDILALYATLPQKVVMVAKRSLLILPVFSWGMWLAGFVFINRRDRASAFRSMARAGDRLRRGRSVLVFPEGTRGDSVSLQSFKKGGFVLAQQAGFRVVPVGIAGTYSVLPRDTFPVYPGRIAVAVGAPMSPPPPGEPLDEFMAQVSQEVDRLRGEAKELWAESDR
jgi:1-acyl-sn-glycerol-3-phosphate acyltransferase